MAVEASVGEDLGIRRGGAHAGSVPASAPVRASYLAASSFPYSTALCQPASTEMPSAFWRSSSPSSSAWDIAEALPQPGL